VAVSLATPGGGNGQPARGDDRCGNLSVAGTGSALVGYQARVLATAGLSHQPFTTMRSPATSSLGQRLERGLEQRLGRRGFVAALAVALLPLGASTTACYGKGKNAPAPIARTTVRVVNQGFLDRNIYVMRGSERIRLGTVSGNSSSTLTIPATIVPSLISLRFVADPIGGRAPAATEEITVSPGDEVVLTIPPS